MTNESDPDPKTGESFRSVYAQLHALAQNQMRDQRKDHTLQASALVNEAWLRFRDLPDSVWRDREHFLAIAATAMRQVLVDHARKRAAGKRGGGGDRISLHESGIPAHEGAADIIGFDDALRRLEAVEPRKAKVVTLRVYGGMTIEEVAKAIGVSHMTVSTDWKIACAWLGRELESTS